MRRPSQSPCRPRGIALITVMAVLAIAGLAVVTSLRLGGLQAMLAGHQADQQRALAAAEALLLDAEADILGRRADGRPCPADAPDAAQLVGCRRRGTDTLPAAPYFPQTVDGFDEVRALLQVGAAVPCQDGICAPSSLAALAALEDEPALRAVGARLGQFTGAPARDAPPGWYWVEMFRYQSAAEATRAPLEAEPDPTRPFIYRITALALGLKPGTRAVVQSLFVPYPSAQLP